TLEIAKQPAERRAVIDCAAARGGPLEDAEARCRIALMGRNALKVALRDADGRQKAQASADLYRERPGKMCCLGREFSLAAVDFGARMGGGQPATFPLEHHENPVGAVGELDLCSLFQLDGDQIRRERTQSSVDDDRPILQCTARRCLENGPVDTHMKLPEGSPSSPRRGMSGRGWRRALAACHPSEHERHGRNERSPQTMDASHQTYSQYNSSPKATREPAPARPDLSCSGSLRAPSAHVSRPGPRQTYTSLRLTT